MERPTDKRKTFIGTPYWYPANFLHIIWIMSRFVMRSASHRLAPEVVMVNSLFKPYDNKVLCARQFFSSFFLSLFRTHALRAQVDVWSLGITCIELAETKPPRYGMDPTKAMFEIPRSPAPKLAEESKWYLCCH